MKYIPAIILLAMAFLVSCDDNAVIYDAEPLAVDSIEYKAGYLWYTEEFSNYAPDTDLVKEISAEYNEHKGKLKFVVYAKPECTCPGDHRYFPKYMRILMDAGIDKSNIEIFSMTSTNNHHPYEEKLTVQLLPGFFLIYADNWVYDISDEFGIGADATNGTLESQILKGLKAIQS